MAKEQLAAWNEEVETYEDFLARLPRKVQDGILDGTVKMVQPMEGLRYITRQAKRLMGSESGDEAKQAYIDEIEGMSGDDAMAMIANIEHVGKGVHDMLEHLRLRVVEDTVGPIDMDDPVALIQTMLDLMKSIRDDTDLPKPPEEPKEPWQG